MPQESELNDALITIRSAIEHDEPAITNLIHSEHLNPCGLDWRRFLVATYEANIVGAVQLRHHGDGSKELGSLVVRQDARRRGIASRLIDTLLSKVSSRVFMITSAQFAAHYAQWGFRHINAVEAPSSIMRNYAVGQLLGGFLSLICGRTPKRLAILDRNLSGVSTQR